MRHKILPVLLLFLSYAVSIHACTDSSLEWSKVEITDEQTTEDGYLGISEVVARLKSALKVERKISDQWPGKLKLVFIGWGKEEQPANEHQIAGVFAAFNLFFADNMLDMNAAALVAAPDYEKLAESLTDGSSDYAVSFIVKSSTLQWKTYLTRDLCSIFKLRLILQEKVEAECKLVDKSGNLIFFDTFTVKPSQLFDFNYKDSGYYVEFKAERYSSDLIMNIIADKLPAPAVAK